MALVKLSEYCRNEVFPQLPYVQDSALRDICFQQRAMHNLNSTDFDEFFINSGGLEYIQHQFSQKRGSFGTALKRAVRQINFCPH